MFEDKNDLFYISLIKSFGVHVLILVFVYAGAYLFNGFGNRAENIKLLGTSVRVDVVAMPKITALELKKLEAIRMKAVRGGKTKDRAVVEESPDVETAKVSQPDENIEVDKNTFVKEQKEKKKKSFLSMVNKLSKKKVKSSAKRPSKRKRGIKSGSEDGEEITEAQRRALKKLVLAGNKLNKGNSFVQVNGEVDESELSNYSTKAIERIRTIWALPSFLKDKGLKCSYQIFVSGTGELLMAKLTKSSGNEDFDTYAKAAIVRAFPMDPPVEEIKAALRNGKVHLAFPLE